MRETFWWVVVRGSPEPVPSYLTSSLSSLVCVMLIMVCSLSCPCVGGFITVFHRQTLANLLLKSGNSKQSLCGAVLRNTQNTVMQPMPMFFIDIFLTLYRMHPQLVTTGCHECLVFQRKNFTLAFSAAESVGIPSSLVSGLGFLTECCL